ncbi:MAG TPA: N-acetylmuramoyl-L-alanine amidase [Limnochordales bacterium]
MRGPLVVVIHRRHLVAAGLLGVLTAAVVSLALAYVRPLPAAAPVAEAVSGHTVAVDAGHGGPDPGAIGVAGAKEKDITLAIALKLQQVLHRSAVYTVLTREGDYDLVQGAPVPHRQREDLLRRAALVNASGADVFVSLHANSFPSPRWSGAQTFYLEGREESRRLAEAIQASLARHLGPNRRTARPADLRLLRAVEVPAALVEVGFLSNPDEERLLQDAEYQWRIAEAIAEGIFAFLSGALAPPTSDHTPAAGGWPRLALGDR